MSGWTRRPLVVGLCNIGLAYAVMMVTRVAFYVVNRATFAPYMSADLLRSMLAGSLVFDTSAVLYLNAAYLVLLWLPFHLKERPAYYRALHWVWGVPNALGAAMNLCDAVYFGYTGRRTTVTVFDEFSRENNLAGIMLTEAINHWGLVLVMLCVLAILIWGYRRPAAGTNGSLGGYYARQVLTLAVAVPAAIVGMRGSATAGTRPITVNNANQFVNRPVEAAVVLNTPFSMIRSIGKPAFVTPEYMSDSEMERAYTPVHAATVSDSLSRPGRNIVILIVESMGKEYIGALNRHLDGGQYRGYMPFVDQLVAQSLTFTHSYANGRISMESLPSVLCGLPMMVEPLFLTPASLNDIDGLSSLLRREQGYRTAFFHGGHNITLGFSAFAHSIGYERYYGLDEYCDDPHYGGMRDFDGKWAIWDEPFLQFTLDRLDTIAQPFLATVFTASSHHPYNVPREYEQTFPAGDPLPIHRCIRYTDLSLRRFFERARHQSWYNNTVFVLVADHTNQTCRREYQTDLGLYSIPIVLFTPDGTLKPTMRDDIVAQQTDLLPTLLHLAGYRGPFVAFGDDLLATPPDQKWAFSYNAGIYQLVKGDLMLQFDGTKTTAVYAFKTDRLLERNLVGQRPEQAAMERLLKAIIRQYMQRMNQNRLTVREQ